MFCKNFFNKNLNCLVAEKNIRLNFFYLNKFLKDLIFLNYSKISFNGINLLSSTYFTGMGIVVFDPLTLNPDTSTWYNLYNTHQYGIDRLYEIVLIRPSLRFSLSFEQESSSE